MTDPGRAYLYQKQSQGNHRRSDSLSRAPSPFQPASASPEGNLAHGSLSRQGSAVRGGAHTSHIVAPATVAPPLRLPNIPTNSNSGHMDRWEAAVGNIEDARVAFDVIARAVEDAVFLDEDAYKQILPTMQFTVQAQAQQHRISELEQQLQEANDRLTVVEHACLEAQQQSSELRNELESNAEVFKMHYAELLAKEEELSKLRVIVQALSGQ